MLPRETPGKILRDFFTPGPEGRFWGGVGIMSEPRFPVITVQTTAIPQYHPSLPYSSGQLGPSVSELTADAPAPRTPATQPPGGGGSGIRPPRPP